MAKINRIGFGQVELNQLAGEYGAQILADKIVDTKVMGEIIEQGRFAKYDAPAKNGEGRVTTDVSKAKGGWYMIYNEEQTYDERDWRHKDFALKAEDFIGGEIPVRLYIPMIGDKFTTNTFGQNTGDKNTRVVTDIDLKLRDLVGVGEDGYLTNEGYDENGPVYQVMKVYHMPDGQNAVKLICVQVNKED